MPLSRCNIFNRENARCGLTAEHPGKDHSFGPIPPGPPSPPPRPDYGERYETDEEYWRRVPRLTDQSSTGTKNG